MKILMSVVPAVAALAMIGCVDLVEKEDVDDMHAKMDKLSAQVAQKNDMQALLYEELVKRTNGLEKKVGEMDIAVNTMKAQVERLEDQTKTMRAQIEALSRGPGAVSAPGQPSGDEAKKLKIEEILLEVQTTLSELGSGKIKAYEAATRLKPWAQHAAPIVITGAIRRRSPRSTSSLVPQAVTSSGKVIIRPRHMGRPDWAATWARPIR